MSSKEIRDGSIISRSKFVTVSGRKFYGLLIAIPIVALAIGILIGFAIPRHNQSGGSTSKSHVDVKKLLFEEMKSENIKSNLKTLSEKVHMAGTHQDENILANMIAEKWKEQLDDVKEYRYEVLLSMPNFTDPNYITTKSPDGKMYDKSDMYEPELTDKENFENIPPTFNAYGAEGDVEGDMVYVNYGRSKDFIVLEEEYGINVTGKICISKYGKGFRGTKAKTAETHGCAGLILFTDPNDYGGRDDPNTAYPDNWWMPHKGVQRGTVFSQGDPLTPFFPANEYAYRMLEREAGLPNIPVQPISSDDAHMYLSKLGGEIAPEDWQGKIANLTYRFGGKMADEYKNHTFVMHVANYRPMKEIKNIVGFIRGYEEPDRYVILGNHRDAWVFGAIDPSSGTAVMLEVARAMGEIVKTGKWRPRRTIVFCSWAAEEYGLIGSFEWTEQFEKKLLLEAVTYLNVDLAIQGNATLRAKATPNLRELLFNVTKGVPNPDPNEIANQRTTVYDTWKHVYYDNDDTEFPYVQAVRGGSDIRIILQKAGLSSIDIRYTYDQKTMSLPSYPIYHSAHETVEYVEKFVDPNYKFSLAVAQTWADIARRIADDIILPFDPVGYANEVKKIVDYIQKRYSATLDLHEIKLDHLYSAVSHFSKSAKGINAAKAEVDTSNLLETRRFNDKLMYLERAFLDFNGLPERQSYRHVVFAPTLKSSGPGFPGFTDAIVNAEVDGNWENVKKQLAVITHHLASAAAFLEPL